MFVRQKINRSGSVRVQIVQKVGRINKVVRTIGCSTDPVEIEKLVSQAHYEKERIYGSTLFDPRPVEDLKNVTNDCIRVIGPDLVFSELYSRIGFDVIREPLLRSLAISRLTHPDPDPGAVRKAIFHRSSNSCCRCGLTEQGEYRGVDKA